ncbi:N-acetylmuramoyl-L-alanine amidase [Mastigocladopsis repens]|uniref:N-acetylmuramoyl-L-alanine amidase n=1 Tax=Mastigocladopsis repens TaxID=221287 RepID=UPI0002EDF1F9|nr:N-acetylmuramoyl-L-alanine amidase [Mastigocladopsis repens]
MKYGIDCGHNCAPDTGAVGLKSEDKLTLAVGTLVKTKLQALGHEVVSCNPKSTTSVSNSLAQRCRIANQANVDFYVSIHFNAFNGKAHGSEVFAMSEAGRKVALAVLGEICQLGFFNRGVKDGSHLYVVKNTNAPAILIECCFIDCQQDMNRFDVEAMANAIVLGLTGKLPSAGSTSKDSVEPDKWQLFVKTLKTTSISTPDLKVAQLAQAILESGRGTSNLFLLHNNPYGLKWRPEMRSIASPVDYHAHDGQEEYCKFATLENAVKGYWVFINRSPYVGWSQYSQNPEAYLKFIVNAGYCPDGGYVNKVLAVLPEAMKLLTN